MITSFAKNGIWNMSHERIQNTYAVDAQKDAEVENRVGKFWGLLL